MQESQTIELCCMRAPPKYQTLGLNQVTSQRAGFIVWLIYRAKTGSPHTPGYNSNGLRFEISMLNLHLSTYQLPISK